MNSFFSRFALIAWACVSSAHAIPLAFGPHSFRSPPAAIQAVDFIAALNKASVCYSAVEAVFDEHKDSLPAHLTNAQQVAAAYQIQWNLARLPAIASFPTVPKPMHGSEWDLLNHPAAKKIGKYMDCAKDSIADAQRILMKQRVRNWYENWPQNLQLASKNPSRHPATWIGVITAAGLAKWTSTGLGMVDLAIAASGGWVFNLVGRKGAPALQQMHAAETQAQNKAKAEGLPAVTLNPRFEFAIAQLLHDSQPATEQPAVKQALIHNWDSNQGQRDLELYQRLVEWLSDAIQDPTILARAKNPYFWCGSAFTLAVDEGA